MNENLEPNTMPADPSASIRDINAQADIQAALRISVHQQCMKIYVACIVDLR